VKLLSTQTLLPLGKKNSRANTQLGQLLGLSKATSATDTTSLDGKKIIMRILPQHCDAFDAILASEHGPAAEKLLKYNGGVAYMIVGIKTIFDGSIQVDHTRTAGKAQLPISKAVAAGTQGSCHSSVAPSQLCRQTSQLHCNFQLRSTIPCAEYSC